MGLNYAIDLYFPIEQLESALVETVRIAHIREGNKSTSIKFLNGRKLEVPFSSHFNPGKMELTVEGGNFQLETELLFPVDHPLQQYVDSMPVEYRDGYFAEVNGNKFVGIGNIYLYIHVGYKYVRLRYMAATTRMSLLFVESTSVHERFAKLLKTAKGLTGLIFTESEAYPLLLNSNQKIYFYETDYLVEDEEAYYDYGYIDVDRLTEKILLLLPQQ